MDNCSLRKHKTEKHGIPVPQTSSSPNNDTRIKTYTGYCGLCHIAYPVNQNSTLEDHLKSNQHMNNIKAKQFKNVLAAQQEESLREATALDISNINFDHEETVVKKEEIIKEEETYLSEAGPSKDISNINSTDMTTKITQSQDLYKCYICDKNFNQYDLEIHFVTDHVNEEIL